MRTGDERMERCVRGRRDEEKRRSTDAEEQERVERPSRPDLPS